jgi:hypothetical protein
MPWEYNQKTGELRHNGKKVAKGYSGAGEGRNNPGKEGVENVGPIPAGEYKIGAGHHHTKLGPQVMNLDPVGHDALGRTAFRIHGDNIGHDASHGCIIINRGVRDQINKSPDKVLRVISGAPPATSSAGSGAQSSLPTIPTPPLGLR